MFPEKRPYSSMIDINTMRTLLLLLHYRQETSSNRFQCIIINFPGRKAHTHPTHYTNILTINKFGPSAFTPQTHPVQHFTTHQASSNSLSLTSKTTRSTEIKSLWKVPKRLESESEFLRLKMKGGVKLVWSNLILKILDTQNVNFFYEQNR